MVSLFAGKNDQTVKLINVPHSIKNHDIAEATTTMATTIAEGITTTTMTTTIAEVTTTTTPTPPPPKQTQTMITTQAGVTMSASPNQPKPTTQSDINMSGNQKIEDKPKPTSSMLSPVVGGVITLLILVVLCIILVFCVKQLSMTLALIL